MVSFGVGGKDVGGVTLPILKVGRPFAVNREFRTVSKVPGSKDCFFRKLELIGLE